MNKFKDAYIKYQLQNEDLLFDPTNYIMCVDLYDTRSYDIYEVKFNIYNLRNKLNKEKDICGYINFSKISTKNLLKLNNLLLKKLDISTRAYNNLWESLLQSKKNNGIYLYDICYRKNTFECIGLKTSEVNDKINIYNVYTAKDILLSNAIKYIN